MTVKLSVSKLILGNLPALRAFVRGVPLDVAVELRGRGASSHALVASSSGRVQVLNIGPGVIRHDFEAVGNNLIYHFVSAFDVFRRSNRDVLLECVAIDLPFDHGVAIAEQSMELRTRRLHVRPADGSIAPKNASIWYSNPKPAA